MVEPSRHIKKHIKKHLISEAGGKCANPGCQNAKVEMHHIDLWSVVKTHDQAHMIAVCPSCHDACHHGKLIIDDDTLYRWKKIERPKSTIHSHVYVEPVDSPRLLVGSCTFVPSKPREIKMFELSPRNKLSFTIKDTWIQVNAILSDKNGNTIANITDNNLTGHLPMGVELIQRPGKFQLLVPVKSYYLPAQHILMMREFFPSYGTADKIIAIDLEVKAPGRLKIQGFWSSDDNSVIITEEAISFCYPGLARPISIIGEGEDSILVFDGSLEASFFSFDRSRPHTTNV